MADDDEDTRQLIAFALAAQGYAVTEAADGEAALDLLTMCGVARREAGTAK